MASGEGDGGTIFEQLGVYTNIDKCIDDALTLKSTNKLDPVHPGMTIENNYVVFTERNKCKETCRYNCFGGYVIEKIPTNMIHNPSLYGSFYFSL